MQSRAWCLAAIAACCLTEMAALPAKAGWGADVSRMVVNSLVRQAVYRVMYQPRSYSAPRYQQPYQQDSSNYSYNSPSQSPAATTAPGSTHHTNSTHKHSTATVHGNLQYPKDNSFVPPPPPYPEVYPGGADTSISSASKHSSGMDLVPPPPPAPSVWDDMTPAAALSAKPTASPPKVSSADGIKQAMVPKHEKIGGYTKHPTDGGIIGKNDSTSEKGPGAEQVSDSDETADTVPKPAPDFHRRKVAVHRATGHAGT